jgi:LysM domain
MTRETKVGLVVSFSFVCLVGTVLFYKFKPSALPTSMEEVEAEQVVMEPIPEPVAMPGRSLTPSPTVSMAPQGGMLEPNRLPPLDDHNVVRVAAPANATPTPLTPTDPTRTSASAGTVPSAPITGFGSSEAPLPPPVAPPPSSPAVPTPSSLTSPSTTTIPLPGSTTSPGAPAPAVATVPTAVTEPTPAPLTSGIPAATASSTTSLPVTPEPAHTGSAPVGGLPDTSLSGDHRPETTPGSMTPPATTTAPASTPPVTIPTAPIGGSSVTPTAPMTSSPPPDPIAGSIPHSDSPTAAVPGTSGSRPDPVTPAFSTSPSSVPAPSTATPGASLGQPIPTPLPPTPAPGADLSPGVMAPTRSLPTTPAADDAPLGSGRPATTGTPLASQVAQANLPVAAANTDPVHPLPPVGTQTTAVTPPIPTPVPSRPPVSQVPQVDSYDEQSYHCKPGDTLTSLSSQYYNSDKYDQALLLFNREHPMASDGIRQDPPVLQPGQVVFIPQMKILEKRYADKIPGLVPVAPTAPVVAVPAPVGAVPQPMTSTSHSLGTRPYRVRSTGEAVREIAARTLGNAERWPEINQLNRFDPAYPIPAGTILQLPADARVEPADMPPQLQPLGR